MIKEVKMRLDPRSAASEKIIRMEAARVSGVDENEINDFRVTRRSIDARKRNVVVDITAMIALGSDKSVGKTFERYNYKRVDTDVPCVAVVGCGPAGLFAALELIKNGIRPIVLERGRDVDSRRIDIAGISRSGKVNPDSNYCFGEGGAGAYSDGKLFTRSKKRGSVEEVLTTFVQHGASEDILIDAHPHIGSDKLPHVIKRMRETIIENGGEVHFETLVTGLQLDDGVVTGVKTDKGTVRSEAVIMATGHSAHDTFRMLHSSGVSLEPKGLAVGVRLEHPQALIDRIQYHSKQGRGEYLPPAEYSFVTQSGGRGVYSFCMCPGGVIVPAASEAGELVVNGMSASARSGKWANSGMVVELHPGDIPGFSESGPLEMLDLQESLEKKMFEVSGNSIKAPAQRMMDFVNGKTSEALLPTSYAPGIWSADFNDLLPPFITTRLAEGFKAFGSKSRGFLTNGAQLVGLESRTSSPLRILRDKESLESVSHAGLYPVGEGAGYAGGIVSAAIDGIRSARAVVQAIQNQHL